MYKVKKQLSDDRRYYMNIECEELFTVSINAHNHSDTFIGRDKEGNLYYVEEEEAHVGNAYFMAKEFYVLDEVELFAFIDKAYANGHITRYQRDRYRCGDFSKPEEKPAAFSTDKKNTTGMTDTNPATSVADKKNTTGMTDTKPTNFMAEKKPATSAEDIWYCTECGAKHTKGNFCTECGTQRVKKSKKALESAPKQPQTKLVYAERVSVSMGDDCHAPHRCPLEYDENTKLSEFMAKLADYVPSMHNFTWEIVCDLQTLAYLIFDEKRNWTYELAVPDEKLELLLDKYLDKELYEEKEIFCRKHSMYDNMVLLKLDKNKILFVYDNARYWLTSHPYEPCLYIKHNGLTVCTLHNAFEVYDLPEKFAHEEKITGIDGKLYDEEAFLQALAAAIDSGRNEMNFTYAAKLAGQ